MPLTLPNLDDRRWADLVEEGRALIPVYGPDWTDHNAHDPGITLMELLAWIAEMDIYQLNQVPDRHKQKFLALLGIVPRPPIAARAVLGLALKAGSQPVHLPAGLEFSGTDASGTEMKVRSLETVDAIPGSIAAMQYQDDAGYHDLSSAFRRGEPMTIFGSSPLPGAEFYIGFTQALPAGLAVHLRLSFANARSSWKERNLLLKEWMEQQEDCTPATNPCAKPTVIVDEWKQEVALPPHPSVRTVWEFLGGSQGAGKWLPLSVANNQVEDSTRSMTLDGAVRLMLPSAMVQQSVGAVAQSLFYLRCRIVSGRYDAAPMLGAMAYNGILTEQAVPIATTLVVSRNAKIVYAPAGPPKAGDSSAIDFALDSQGHVSSLIFDGGEAAAPKFFVQQYVAPTANDPGKLTMEAALLGMGSGAPEQKFVLPALLAQQSSTVLHTHVSGGWQLWTAHEDFDSATWGDYSYLLDPTSGDVSFSDGKRTNLPPANYQLLVQYRSTDADGGNKTAGFFKALSDSAHNRAILCGLSGTADGWSKVNAQIASVQNQVAASGGAAAESVEGAASRAVVLVEGTDRAVTIEDYERLALATPGTRIARAVAFANLHPSFPCFQAPGLVTVIVVPYLPAARPFPTAGLREVVARYLRRRRVIGTRVEVVGPTYVELIVNASVQATAKTNKGAVRQLIVSTLNAFLDPVSGGPDGTGWPFGRDVYRTEIMQVIAAVAGVDHVLSLSLESGSCEPQCGNVCLGPLSLIVAGTHDIGVV
jgi:hypothetical protein